MPSTLRESLMEAEEQWEHRGRIWQTLRRMVAELDKLQVPYVVVGGIALQHHRFERFTRDVDLLVSSTSDLAAIHSRLIGHGYYLKAPQSRHLRDEVTRTRIEFLVAGEYPGDGKPKPVAFPSPQTVKETSDEGISFVSLKALIEMKLASAKSAAHRIKDRADVLELIHIHGLGPEYADQLNPYVQQEFRELAALPPPSEPD